MARKILTLLIAVILLPGAICLAAEDNTLSPKEVEAVNNIHNVFRRAVNIIKPAVVTVRLYQEMSDMQEHEIGLGSGFIIDKQGYILTNNHVAEGNDKIAVVLDDDRMFEVVDVMLDPDTDLAVLKIDPQGQDLPVARFGNSDDAQVGDFVMAVGSPFGLSQTVTMGIISYKGRQTRILGQWGLEDFIQTDADINKGNSGGPLVNLMGEVIGINSNIFSPTGVSSGYGFAVPSNMAKYVSDELIANKTVKRGYLGVKLYSQTINDLGTMSDKEILTITRQKLDEASQPEISYQQDP